MPLAQTVDTLDSVPEAARGAYVAKDGKFHLDFEIEDTTGLKNTVAATRAERDALDKQVKAWAKLGKSPDELNEMLEAERTKAEQAALKAGKFDEVLATHLGNAKKERDTAVTAAEKKAQAAEGLARNAVVRTELATALTKAKATAEGLLALPKLIGDRVRIEFDDAGEAKPTIFEADGKTPMVGSGPGGLATFDDLVKEATKTFSSLFEGVGGGGGKPPKDGGGSAGKTITRKEFDALDPVEKSAKIRDKYVVVDG